MENRKGKRSSWKIGGLKTIGQGRRDRGGKERGGRERVEKSGVKENMVESKA